MRFHGAALLFPWVKNGCARWQFSQMPSACVGLLDPSRPAERPAATKQRAINLLTHTRIDYRFTINFTFWSVSFCLLDAATNFSAGVRDAIQIVYMDGKAHIAHIPNVHPWYCTINCAARRCKEKLELNNDKSIIIACFSYLVALNGVCSDNSRIGIR